MLEKLIYQNDNQQIKLQISLLL